MSLNKDFIQACRVGDLDKVKSLLKRGADIHEFEDWALRSAARDGHLDVVKYLVEQGAHIHALDDWALGAAVFNGHLNVVSYLREVAGPEYECHECLIRSTCLELCDLF